VKIGGKKRKKKITRKINNNLNAKDEVRM